MIPVLEPCFQGVPDMWFFSTVLFLLIVICSVAGVVNALAVRRELHARREQGISCPGAGCDRRAYLAGTVRKVPVPQTALNKKSPLSGRGNHLRFDMSNFCCFSVCFLSALRV